MNPKISPHSEDRIHYTKTLHHIPKYVKRPLPPVNILDKEIKRDNTKKNTNEVEEDTEIATSELSQFRTPETSLGSTESSMFTSPLSSPTLNRIYNSPSTSRSGSGLMYNDIKSGPPSRASSDIILEKFTSEVLPKISPTINSKIPPKNLFKKTVNVSPTDITTKVPKTPPKLPLRSTYVTKEPKTPNIPIATPKPSEGSLSRYISEDSSNLTDTPLPMPVTRSTSSPDIEQNLDIIEDVDEKSTLNVIEEESDGRDRSASNTESQNSDIILSFPDEKDESFIGDSETDPSHTHYETLSSHELFGDTGIVSNNPSENFYDEPQYLYSPSNSRAASAANSAASSCANSPSTSPVTSPTMKHKLFGNRHSVRSSRINTKETKQSNANNTIKGKKSLSSHGEDEISSNSEDKSPYVINKERKEARQSNANNTIKGKKSLSSHGEDEISSNSEDKSLYVINKERKEARQSNANITIRGKKSLSSHGEDEISSNSEEKSPYIINRERKESRQDLFDDIERIISSDGDIKFLPLRKFQKQQHSPVASEENDNSDERVSRSDIRKSSVQKLSREENKSHSSVITRARSRIKTPKTSSSNDDVDVITSSNKFHLKDNTEDIVHKRGENSSSIDGKDKNVNKFHLKDNKEDTLRKRGENSSSIDRKDKNVNKFHLKDNKEDTVHKRGENSSFNDGKDKSTLDRRKGRLSRSKRNTDSITSVRQLFSDGLREDLSDSVAKDIRHILADKKRGIIKRKKQSSSDDKSLSFTSSSSSSSEEKVKKNKKKRSSIDTANDETKQNNISISKEDRSHTLRINDKERKLQKSSSKENSSLSSAKDKESRLVEKKKNRKGHSTIRSNPNIVMNPDDEIYYKKVNFILDIITSEFPDSSIEITSQENTLVKVDVSKIKIIFRYDNIIHWNIFQYYFMTYNNGKIVLYQNVETEGNKFHYLSLRPSLEKLFVLFETQSLSSLTADHLQACFSIVK